MAHPVNSGPDPLADVDVLVGIDDTDNETSPGTGWLAQRLLEHLAQVGIAHGRGATRHQLLVDPRVPYTSHNSSACLGLVAEPGVPLTAVHEVAAEFLADRSAPGSDPGVAVIRAHVTSDHRDELIAFGRAAKTNLLDQPHAHAIAVAHHCLLTGVGGTRDGVIGALAAVGLHLSGTDGFFIWLPGIRELRAGRYRLDRLRTALPVADARTGDARRPERSDEVIEVSPWVRPLLVDGTAVLLLEHVTGDDSGRPPWRTAGRNLVRQH